MSNILCVITARAGSVGLPGKNYKEFCGKPLVCWSVIAALECKEISHIVISSNCQHVASACRYLLEKYPERLLWAERPEQYAHSTAMNEDALLHAMQFIKNQHCDLDFEWIVNLQPTSPIRDNNLLSRCIGKIEEENLDSLLTVSEHTPFFWKKNEDETGTPLYDYESRPMRQQLESSDMMFHDNGNVYIVNAKYLQEFHCRTAPNPILFVTDQLQSMQIDTLDDFLILQSSVESLRRTPI